MKASWNAIFLAKRCQRCAKGAPRASAKRNAQVAWGGLRRGKLSVQAPKPRTRIKESHKGRLGRPGLADPARRPEDGRRIASRIPPGQDRGGAQSTQLRGLLGASWGPLGRLLGVLEASWAPLGRSSAPPRRPRGAQEPSKRPKIAPKT